MPIWCSSKIFYMIALNDIYNKQRIFKINYKSTKKDLPEVTQNVKMTWQTLLWYPWQDSHPILLVYALNRYLCARLTSKGSILNVNLKKYPRHIQNPVIDLKMELLSKIVNGLISKLLLKKIYFRCVTGSEFGSDCNKKRFLQTAKDYIKVFWHCDSYYPAGILPTQRQQ